jgi:sugar phosphate isomerase/epimerase
MDFIMRLGARHQYFSTDSISGLKPLSKILDQYNLSAIQAPSNFWEWSDIDCYNFGNEAKSLGIVIGEAIYRGNLLDPDPSVLNENIKNIRLMIKKAELMNIRCVVSLVGSRDVAKGPLSPHPFNFTESAKCVLKDICLRIVDRMSLKITRYAIEPWNNTFFSTPFEIFSFLQSCNDPRIGLHLDQVNLVSPSNYFHIPELIKTTFNLLAEFVVSVHSKDVLWCADHKILRFDEVLIGDGIFDHQTLLNNVAKLDTDLTVFTEHYRTKEEFEKSVRRLHLEASKAGVSFLKRYRQ